MASPHLALADRFVEDCSPAIGSNYDTCGTVTRSEMDHLSKTDLQALFMTANLFHDMDAWFVHTIEMKACGTRLYALYDWIMANSERSAFKEAVTGIKAVKGPSLLHPFVMARQDSVVNQDYWRSTFSALLSAFTNAPGTVASPTDAVNTLLDDASAATFNPDGLTDKTGGTIVEAGVTVIRLISPHNIPMSALRFRPRDIIHTFSRAAGGALEHGTWKVLTSVAGTATDTTNILDVATTDANISGDTFDATPGTAVVIPGVNNVDDFEQWCHNRDNIDPRRRVPFWLQTFRQARCIDSEYRTVFTRLMQSNKYFSEFGDLDLAERNRQDEIEMKKRFVTSFFFNKKISDNQTLTAWESLEAINAVVSGASGIGPANGTQIMSRRANFIGVREQLRCGTSRVFDMANTAIQMYEWLELCYQMCRARKSQGRKVTDLDWYTYSDFAVLFSRSFVLYLENEYGVGVTTANMFNINSNTENVNQLGQPWESYKFKRPAGVNMNIVVDEFFDDFRSEFVALGASHDTAGNLLLCLDIGKPGGANGGTIYWAMTATNRKVYTSADLDQLAKLDSTYRCVMNSVSQEQNLMSHSGTAVVECPEHSAWVENFSNAVMGMTAFDGTLDLL